MNKNRTPTSLGGINLLRPAGATTGDELECLIGMKLRGENLGKWVFPNGGYNAGKERTLKGELIREFHSETGVIIKPIYAQPFYLPRTPGDGLHGSMHKLFVPCTVAEGPSLVPEHLSDEIGQVRYRSVGHLRKVMHTSMGEAYIRALHYFSDTGVFNMLARQEVWEDTGVDIPLELPPEALQPIMGGLPNPNEFCAA